MATLRWPQARGKSKYTGCPNLRLHTSIATLTHENIKLLNKQLKLTPKHRHVADYILFSTDGNKENVNDSSNCS